MDIALNFLYRVWALILSMMNQGCPQYSAEIPYTGRTITSLYKNFTQNIFFEPYRPNALRKDCNSVKIDRFFWPVPNEAAIKLSIFSESGFNNS